MVGSKETDAFVLAEKYRCIQTTGPPTSMALMFCELSDLVDGQPGQFLMSSIAPLPRREFE